MGDDVLVFINLLEFEGDGDMVFVDQFQVVMEQLPSILLETYVLSVYDFCSPLVLLGDVEVLSRFHRTYNHASLATCSRDLCHFLLLGVLDVLDKEADILDPRA